MKNEAIEQYEFLLTTHRELHRFLVEHANVQSIADVRGMTIEELTDLGYFFNEVTQLLEDLRKEIARRHEVVKQVVCMAASQRAATTGSAVEPVRTDYTTATPRIKTHVRLPKRHKDPETYDQIMTGLDVPIGLVQSGVFQLNWNAMADYLDTLKKQGLPLPKGLDEEFKVKTFELTYRRKKEIGTTSYSEEQEIL
jgi:hypothetical protein